MIIGSLIMKLTMTESLGRQKEEYEDPYLSGNFIRGKSSSTTSQECILDPYFALL